MLQGVMTSGVGRPELWLGRLDLFRVHIFSIFIPFYLPFNYFNVLFIFCCSHAQVLGATVVHELPIFCIHTQ